MTDTAIDRAEQQVETVGTQHLDAVTTALAGIDDPHVREAASHAVKLVSGLSQHAQGAATFIETHATQDDLPADHRRRVATERIGDAESKTKAAASQSDTAQLVLTKALQSAAVPKLDKGADLVGLRDEARMVLGSLSGPEALTAAARIAGGRDRALAAVVCSRWGLALLASLGVDDAGEALTAAAVRGAVDHGTALERKAAGALGAVTELAKAHAAALSMAGSHLDRARGLAGGVR
jgi:hypothetical protein